MSNLAIVLARSIKSHLKNHDLVAAEEDLQQLKSIPEVGNRAMVLEVELRVAQGYFEQALQLAEVAFKVYPKEDRLYGLLGKAQFKLGQFHKAKDTLLEGEKLKSTWQKMYWLGRTFSRLKRFQDALHYFRQVEPYFDRATLDVAWVFEQLGQLDLALEHVEKYAQHHPQNSFAQKRATDLKLQLMPKGDIKEEIEELETWGEEVPQHLWLARIRNLAEQRDRAEIEAAIKEQPDYYDKEKVQLAWAFYHNDLLDLALDAFLQIQSPNWNSRPFISSLLRCARELKREGQVIGYLAGFKDENPKVYGLIRNLSKSRKD